MWGLDNLYHKKNAWLEKTCLQIDEEDSAVKLIYNLFETCTRQVLQRKGETLPMRNQSQLTISQRNIPFHIIDIPITTNLWVMMIGKIFSNEKCQQHVWF